MADDSVVQTLLDSGWIQETSGSHHLAWKQFWGRPLKPAIRQPWESWVAPIKSRPEPDSDDAEAWRLARAVLGEEDDVEGIPLPDCRYLKTPWVDELKQTQGRIMITRQCERFDGVLNDFTQSYDSGILIEGQRGVGKTYLAWYLLAAQLSQCRTIIFALSSDAYLLFGSIGVFRCHGSLKLRSDSMPSSIREIILPEFTQVIYDTNPHPRQPPYEISTGYYSLVQLCRPDPRYFHAWERNLSPTILMLDALTPPDIVAGAYIQTGYPNRKEGFVGLLQSIHDFGSFSRACFTVGTDRETLYTALDERLSALSSDDVEHLAQRASVAGLNHSGLLCPENDCDIFLLRRDEKDGVEYLRPTLASRYVVGKMRERFSFLDLYSFRDMRVIRKPPDGLLGSRLWLFEHLSHALLSSGSLGGGTESSRPYVWEQVFPPHAKRTKGALALEHFSRSQVLHIIDDELSISLEPGTYNIRRVVSDLAFHAATYVVPYPRKRTKAQSPGIEHRPITRASLKDSGTASTAAIDQTRRPTRSSRTRDKAVRATVPSTGPPPKKTRLKAERRFAVFMQMNPHGVLSLRDEEILRLDAFMARDTTVEYFFVLVSLLGLDCDLTDLDVLPLSILSP
ncbi:unnamed protein product [Peniophora sp. CBMAI 1063]|nr:unnamed protein product [Peniophora sp. CBMAI 1063]